MTVPKRTTIHDPISLNWPTGALLIRTKQMKVGLASNLFPDDVCHIWIDHDFYRVTDKGTLIKESWTE